MSKVKLFQSFLLIIKIYIPWKISSTQIFTARAGDMAQEVKYLVTQERRPEFEAPAPG